jgi:phage tail sheath protein FI
MYPGEYTQPLVRKTLVQVPVISGYVTSRLQAQDHFQPVISGTNTNMLVTLENTGVNATTVSLRETSDRSISGTRYTIMNAVTLVPGGQSTQLVNKGYLPYVELYCTGSDTTNGQTQSNIRMQIDSRRQWTEMGFAKDDPFYPPQLFQAKEVPGPLT